MPEKVAKIAVSAATYWIDKPYEYRIPEILGDAVQPGMRISVPFSAGNRRSEGIVLAVSDVAEHEKLKNVTAVLDDTPLLTQQQLQLALFMRERFFCTVYEAVRAMLPAGLWFNKAGMRRVNDKTVTVAKLAIPPEEASDVIALLEQRTPARARLLQELLPYGEMPLRELLTFTGSTRATFNCLLSDGYVTVYERAVLALPDQSSGERAELPVLNEEQCAAFQELRHLTENRAFSTALLEGVTGSGKTSVYIRLIDSVLQRGRTAILLVPEIALTPQMLQTFSSYFGEEIAVLHSSLSPRQRVEEWKRLKTGRAHVAIGTRSAVFAPVEDLGVLIIDEEQESTYRSENTPRYDAREIARYRCFKDGCLLVLGSATPDLCTRHDAEKGKIRFLRLTKRYNEMHLPEVTVVDMKQELRDGRDGNISLFLQEEIRKNIDCGEQSILFLNRRGAHKLVTCVECGFVYQCPNCSVPLTYHSVNNRLVCHYCGFSRRLDEACPDCGGIFKFIGAGTQLVEEELHAAFPGTEVLRMDTDMLTGSTTHEMLFEQFRSRNIPIMIGTQMVTKGLNFENVTLVGVLSADQSLYAGDYRASERTFSLITQVIGRSGRGTKPGRAVIQTFTPRNEVIRQSAAQDYEAFYASEILLRGIQKAPPFADLLAVTAVGKEEGGVVRACRTVKSRLSSLLSDGRECEFLGPVPLPVMRINNRYRYRILLRCRLDRHIRRCVADTIIALSTDKQFKGISFYADQDPEY